MRLLVLGLAMLACGAFCNSSSAAFMFTLQTPSISNVPGSNGNFNLLVTSDQPVEFFTVTGGNVTLNFGTNVGTISETTSLPGTYFASNAGPANIISGLTYTISPAAVPGTFDSFTVTIAGLSGTNPGNINTPFSVSTGIQTITAIPEPSSLALLGLAAVGGGAYRRFRKTAASKKA